MDSSYKNRALIEAEASVGLVALATSSGDDTGIYGWQGAPTINAFNAGEGTDLLVMNWSPATADIRRTYQGYGVYRYSTSVVVNGESKPHLLDYSGVERFQLTGGAGNDELFGGDLDDELKGGNGHDRLYGYGGRNTLDGGGGTDLVIASVASTASRAFRLRLADARSSAVVINAGTDLQTSWRAVEFVHLTTAAGNDTLDARGIRADAALLNRSGWEVVHPGNRFNSGEGNDTFAVDLGSRGHHIFDGQGGTDLLVMDWSGATATISRNYIGYGSYRYSTTLTSPGTSQDNLLDYQSFNVERFQLSGGAGNDELFGGDLDDILIGGGGQDRLWGYGGKGSYDGGDGTDLAVVSIASTRKLPFVLKLGSAQSSMVTVNRGKATQTSWRAVEFMHLNTAAGNDTLDARGIQADAAALNGNSWSTQVQAGHKYSAGDGNDTFAVDLGSRGHHIFDGQNGTDLLLMDWSSATQDIRRAYIGYGSYRYSTTLSNGGQEQQVLLDYQSYTVERFQLTGGARNDELFGSSLDDILKGGAGNDRLWGSGGRGTFDGGFGTDLVVANVASTVSLGFNLKLGTAKTALVTANSGTPIQTGWRAVEFVHLTTAAGKDVLDVRGISADATLLNREGWDAVHAGHWFRSGGGDDSFAVDLGSRGHHIFDGEDGTDLLVMDWSTAEADIRRVYTGYGVYRYATTVTVGKKQQPVLLDYQSLNVERFQLSGGAANDELFGASLDDVLKGGGGHDRLFGYGGKNTFDGGDGTDLAVASIATTPAESFSLRLADARLSTVVVNAGTDLQTRWREVEFVHLTTGAGNDSLDLRGINADATLLNRDGWDAVAAGTRFISGDGNDTFAVDLGSRGQQYFDGENGTDLLVMDWRAAKAEIAHIYQGYGVYRYSTKTTVGGLTRDVFLDYQSLNVERYQLTGGIKNDQLSGGNLDDIISGGLGSDRLNGGLGSDQFRYTSLGESTRSSLDLITDFRSEDRIAAPIAAATSLTTAFGTITEVDLASEAAIDTALGRRTFAAGSVRALQLGGDTVVAVNDGSAGYQAASDLLVRLQNFSVSGLAPIQIVPV
jgi:Ca2+-binding RTX toxin-like protein